MTQAHIEASPWFRFHAALRFTDIYRITTQQKIYKFELWDDYGDDDFAIQQIMAKTHPDFKFVHNGERLQGAREFAHIMHGHYNKLSPETI